MQISDRLRTVAGFVTEGYSVADIGTDHGYVPIELIKSKKIPRALAMDIGEGPLKRAEEHIRRQGLSGLIETRLSDGVKELKAGEADSVVIAGMGGALTVKILTEGEAVLNSVKELILSPHTEIYLVRQYLLEHGYDIVRETMVYDMEKYYTVIRAVHTEEKGIKAVYDENKYNYIYGKLLLENPSDVFLSYMESEKRKAETVLAHLPENGKTEKKRRETEKKILYIDTIRNGAKHE